MYAYEAGIFDRDCRALADAARACGAQLRKLPEHALSVEAHGESVAFPIASDERDWALTTPEEAFYAAMLDAEGFSEGAAGDVLAADSDAARRVLTLATLLGGNAALENVLRAGGLRDGESRFRR